MSVLSPSALVACFVAADGAGGGECARRGEERAVLQGEGPRRGGGAASKGAPAGGEGGGVDSEAGGPRLR
eukprot:7363333-Pyramimonas_sp.AAC.1